MGRGTRLPLSVRVLRAAGAAALAALFAQSLLGFGDAALEEMRRCSGTQFDPDVVEALCAEVGAPRSGVDARAAVA